MKNIGKVITVILGIIAVGGVIAGIVDRREERTREREAEEQGKAFHQPYGLYEKYLKRPLDFILSAVAIIILLPLLLIIAIFVRFKLGSPVIFTQERPGRDGEIFTLRKFRSMTSEVDENGNLLPDEQRLTSFGSFLRSTSLDELLELFSILTGSMSIVGPRPLLVEYFPRYNERQKHRHDIRPGLTSLSASKKRNLASWSGKLEDDVKYTEKITFLGDLKIILDTVRIVLKRDGISSETSATMEVFMGNEEGGEQ